MNVRSADLPRIFQANIDRFFIRVVQPSLEQMPQLDNVALGEARSPEEFLDQCAKRVDDHTATEARRSFAFVLSAIFRTPIETMVPRYLFQGRSQDGETGLISKLLDQAVRSDRINFGPSDKTVDAIKQLYLLANVVRHGDGRSCDELYEHARHFWNHASHVEIQRAKKQGHLSERIKVKDEHLRDYARALSRFWGLADREPFAVIDPPY